MELSSSSRILIGLSLDSNDSKELLSWAIRVLANPNDTIVAVHVLVGENMKKRVSVRRRISQLRQAKAYVISVLGEFAQTCWSKQVNLEAKVALSSTVGGGLVEEAKSISADFLLVRGSRNKTNKIGTSKGITKYCFEHIDEGCTMISVGSSPRTVLLDGLEGQSNSTEDDTFSTRASSMTYTPSSDPKIKRKSKLRKSQFSFRFIISFLGSPFRIKSFNMSKIEKHQPLLKCFSYENISNATNDFHQDNLVGRGGYSEVYKGVLGDGETIAVKRLAKDNNDPNKEKEFLMELGVIGHITDFGLAKWLPNKWTHHAVIPVEGTFGYLAPEVFMHGIVDEKTDIYAFGVLLLEIVTGRRPVDSSKQNILLWAKPLMESGNIGELADPRMEGRYDAEQLYRVILTASYCVRQTAICRPTMTEVLELLTSGQDYEVGKSWRIPKFTSDELDDYSMIFGYDVPSDISLEDYL
ncbi:hypothetical protein TSUD_201350 [Trifolium subterraneum]|uniref:Protein kinase domain-containing protein n=1 Tax=Trifolium subterraneum TaxID=3900 RepID=A0A2Z6LVF4_TRISU|nr:hypothetical protein TSUD_201350 [Trifolium subterraneum]